MKKRKWIPALIVYIILLLILTILLFILMGNSPSPDINWVRNYYNIVSSITSSIVGITGIILGMFYYFDKERRSKTNILKKEIEDYDTCVKNILKLTIKDEEELKETRTKIDSINDRINMMLDNDTKFIRLDDRHVSKILNINSVVEKSEVIMRISFDELKRVDKASVLDVYEAALKEALLVCYGELK